MKKYKLLIFTIVTIIYLEIIFSLTLFKTITWNFIYTILFSIMTSLFLYLIATLFKKSLINKILYIFLMVFFICFFIAQIIYYQLYESFISFLSLTTGTGQVFGFAGEIVRVALSKALPISLCLVPLIALVIMLIRKKLNTDYLRIRNKGIVLGIIILLYGLISLGINTINTKPMYSNKNLYYNVHSPLLTAKNMGMITTFRLDFQRFVFGFEDKIDTNELDEEEETKEPVVEKEVEYNKLDIDFDTLISNTKNSNIKSIHNYVSKQEPSKKNDYTGMFAGKNLIVFVAEAFSSIAINKDITPNLYKLYQEGFQFDNFYTPIFPISTADGEYITDTSLIPKEGVWSVKAMNGNYMLYSYANVFEELGYSSNAYHDHNYNYYDRDKYIKTMGYNSYKACKKGLNIKCKIWPESDNEMIKATTNDYIKNEHFLAYYMTVSGHLNYTKTGNSMVNRNWSAVKNLPYSEKARGYLAAQREFDKAIGELIKRLEEADRLEDTVIVISGDHYPYGLNLNQINELSTYKRDNNFEKHHSIALIWSGSMKEPIKVDKISSSLDLLPTVLNLFGIEYDSRLLMGRDLLSDSLPLVIFSNRSFITDKGRYNSVNKKFYPVESLGEDFNQDEYVKQINSIIYNKYKYSRLILETNYYKSLKSEIARLKTNKKDE